MPNRRREHVGLAGHVPHRPFHVVSHCAGIGASDSSSPDTRQLTGTQAFLNQDSEADILPPPHQLIRGRIERGHRGPSLGCPRPFGHGEKAPRPPKKRGQHLEPGVGLWLDVTAGGNAGRASHQ